MLQVGRFKVRSGTVIGQSHKRVGLNNQDALKVANFEIGGTQYLVGVVADGCSTEDKKKSRNEVGSRLLTQFALSEMRLMLGARIPTREVPGNLYPRCVSYVGNVARATVIGEPREIWDFIQFHFLCTLLGFIYDGSDLVCFSSGDGVIVVDDYTMIIEQNNAPLYLAYHQVDRRILGDKASLLPSNFNVMAHCANDIKRFAVGTDGIVSKHPETRASYVPADDLEAIFSHEPRAAAGLQWWLNGQSNLQGRFSDDTTLITLNAAE